MEIIKIIEDKGEIKRNELRQAISSGNSTVQQFYDDAVVFVTGASGFLGKQLVQKLLSSTNVKKIYILLRSRKGKNIEERLKTILDDPVFEFLYKESTDFIEKIIPVEGDVSHLHLGLDDKDWLHLTDEVHIIFHSAATTNFEDPLKKATLTNVRGTREILRLAKSCKLLKSMVHVSTAYANATKSRTNGDIREDFYTSPIQPEALIEYAEHTDEETLDTRMKSLMSDWPNTYTFTKAVSEELVKTMAEDLPVCIVRPTVVISAYREPNPGWVDVKNAFGPSGIIVGFALGVLHSLLIRHDINIDFVPVDIVNNATIVAVWETFNRYNKSDKKTNIYTISSTRNRSYIDKFAKMLNKKGREFVSNKSIWYCYCIESQCKAKYIFLNWLLHYIPAGIVDGLCMVIGEKPRFLKLYKLVSSLTNIFIYYCTNEWNFLDANTLQLYNKISDVDKEIYNFDMETLDTEQMQLIWTLGVKKYIIKDDFEKCGDAIRRQFRFKTAHYILFPLYLFSLSFLLYFIIILICKFFNVLLY